MTTEQQIDLTPELGIASLDDAAWSALLAARKEQSS